VRRSTRWAALVGIVALGGGWLLGPRPAAAHSGARAQLYLADLRLEPAHPAGWTVEAVLTDRDSGQPLPGFDVQITGVSPTGSRFGPVTLLDPELRGHYTAPVTPEPGPWSITVDAKGFPGGAEGIPLRQTAEVRLTPGAGTRTAAAHRSGSSGGANPMTWLVPSALAVVSGVWALAVTRRRSVGVAG
jgi:hypothetical protein